MLDRHSDKIIRARRNPVYTIKTMDKICFTASSTFIVTYVFYVWLVNLDSYLCHQLVISDYRFRS